MTGERRSVHNHGPEEWPGLACNERIENGYRVGACLPPASPLAGFSIPWRGTLFVALLAGRIARRRVRVYYDAGWRWRFVDRPPRKSELALIA